MTPREATQLANWRAWFVSFRFFLQVLDHSGVYLSGGAGESTKMYRYTVVMIYHHEWAFRDGLGGGCFVESACNRLINRRVSSGG